MVKDNTKKESLAETKDQNNNYIISKNKNNVNSLFGFDYDDLKLSITLNFAELHGSKLSVKQFAKIICKLFKIKVEISRINGNEMFKYFKFDTNRDVFIEYNLLDIGKDINIISDALNHKGSDVKTLSEQTLYHLNTSYHPNLNITKINFPPKKLIKFNNGIFNLKTKEFFHKESNSYKNLIQDYDFINAFDFDYLENLSDDNQYILVYNKLIKDLANNKTDQILLFNQLVSAVIEGNGRGKYIMLSGQAGSGKTTFGNVLLNIAGEDYTRYVTMDSFDDDNTINSLSMSTKLVLGDDLQKSAKLVGKSLRYFKTLVDGNKLSVAVKYEPNRVIQTNAVWLQMMNDNPSIYEANDAIKDRTILVNITGRNHRNIKDPAEKEFSRRLDLYTGKRGKADVNFIQAVVSYIVKKIDYFEEFTISDEMRKATEDMVDDANWAYQFTEWLNDMGIFNFSYLSSNDLKEILYYWAMKNNPQMGKPSAKTIKKELEPYLKSYNYEYKSELKSLSMISLLNYNQDLIRQEISPHLDLDKNRNRFWVSNEHIDQNAISDLQNKILNDNSLEYNHLSFKEKIIVEYLSKQGDVDITTWIINTKS